MQVLPLEDEEEDVKLVENNQLDVDEIIRQDLLIVLPLQPLCSPECQGLCPTCGENLNVRKCQCPPADVESPFKALEKLLDEDEKE
jgi:uncharacterized protein